MSFLLDAKIQHCITRVIQSIKKKTMGTAIRTYS